MHGNSSLSCAPDQRSGRVLCTSVARFGRAYDAAAQLSEAVCGRSATCPGQGQMKPEQLEIARLKREVRKLKAERDILKKAPAYFAKEST